MSRHKTCEVAMKIIKVDVKMAMIISWMNRHHEVFTVYSCQGDKQTNSDGEESLVGCYVLWLCYDCPNSMYEKASKYIIKKFKECGAVTEKEKYGGSWRYTTKWPNEKAFKATRFMCLNDIKNMEADPERIAKERAGRKVERI